MAINARITTDWQDGVNLLLGAALFISPWVFNFEGHQTVAWNAHIVGAILALFSLMALLAFQTWEEWAAGVVGLWALASPWLLGFSTMGAATAVHVVIGLLAVVFAIWATYEHGRVA